MSSFQPRWTGIAKNALRRHRTLEQEVLFDLLSHRTLLAGLTLGVAGCALGHAVMALAAGNLAASLSGAPLDKSFTALPRVARLGSSIAVVSYVGLGSALVKA